MPSMRSVGEAIGAAELQVVADFGDVEQHVFQVAGDRDLFDRKGQFAVLDPQAAGAAREIAGDQVHAEAEKLGDEQAFLDVAR